MCTISEIFLLLLDHIRCGVPSISINDCIVTPMEYEKTFAPSHHITYTIPGPPPSHVSFSPLLRIGLHRYKEELKLEARPHPQSHWVSQSDKEKERGRLPWLS